MKKTLGHMAPSETNDGFPLIFEKWNNVVFSPSHVGNASGASVTSQASSISICWVSMGSSIDCFAPETMFLKHVGLPTSSMNTYLPCLLQSAMRCCLQRKLTHPHQQVLEVRVDDARLRVTPSHRVDVPSSGGRYIEKQWLRI